MGNLFSQVWSKFFKSKKEYKLLIVGLANAGKTTLLYRLYYDLTKPSWPGNTDPANHRLKCGGDYPQKHQASGELC